MKKEDEDALTAQIDTASDRFLADVFNSMQAHSTTPLDPDRLAQALQEGENIAAQAEKLMPLLGPFLKAPSSYSAYDSVKAQVEKMGGEGGIFLESAMSIIHTPLCQNPAAHTKLIQ